jgi:hypothetical protein
MILTEAAVTYLKVLVCHHLYRLRKPMKNIS